MIGLPPYCEQCEAFHWRSQTCKPKVQEPLMVLPRAVLEAAALRADLKRRGHAGQPGEGPAGESCKTCKYLVRVHHAGTYLKCRHRMAPKHTNGPGTDVRARDPACERWEALE